MTDCVRRRPSDLYLYIARGRITIDNYSTSTRSLGEKATRRFPISISVEPHGLYRERNDHRPNLKLDIPQKPGALTHFSHRDRKSVV